ncbi:MAG TPA: hypothetical protein PL110_08860 [Candidatus Eremiobacteraeota bacterium]|nr:MAG: hypothetical protein BWY64_03892 [bacterium ADurb.Bin363]HPZ08211.1 hypothetical protein [Candidatus Eremiobacteraeota bacterium]
MSEEYSQDEAIVVSSISEEYSYISIQKCECGGPLKSKMQSLLFKDNRPFDRLKCECQSCGKEKSFYFDISSFFGKNL